jgi:hypothetical protein
MLKFVVALAAVVSLGLAAPAFAEGMAKPMAKPHMMAKTHMVVVHHHYHHHYHHMMKPEVKSM